MLERQVFGWHLRVSGVLEVRKVVPKVVQGHYLGQALLDPPSSFEEFEEEDTALRLPRRFYINGRELPLHRPAMQAPPNSNESIQPNLPGREEGYVFLQFRTSVLLTAFRTGIES